jgi:PPM family protein phosphatase
MSQGFTIESSAISDRGLNEKRPENEDSFLDVPANGIFAVADGVGGAQAGEVASQMAVEILGEAFANRSGVSDGEQVMRQALQQANASIYQMSGDVAKLSRMATTVVALHLDSSVATIGHVGDSRLYMLDPEGNLHRETDDHSMVADEVRAGRMTEEQAENHPSKNIISRALGAEAFVEIDLRTRLVEPESKFLLCSDGVTRHLNDKEIAELLMSSDSPSEICSRIKSICYERGAEDNLTAVVVRLKSSNTSEAMKISKDTSPDLLSLPDFEETTIATARPVESTDDLLDLGPKEDRAAEVSASTRVEPPTNYPEVTASTAAEPPSSATAAQPPEAVSERPVTSAPPAPAGSGYGFIVIAVIGGVLIGILGSYFFLNRSAQPALNANSSNPGASTAPLNAFEERRRDVDKDPVLYLAQNPAPQNAEDFYLVGRAHLLLGDYPKARSAFLDSRSRLSNADPNNSRVLADDLAVMIAVTNNTTVQTSLRSEIDAIRSATSANSSATAPTP